MANLRFPGCALVFLLSLVIAVALGIFAAALQLAIQKGSALLWLFWSGTWFLTGTLFPIETLPKPLHALAEIIPVTHSLNGMRLALLQGANFAALRSEVLYLAIFALLLLPMSLMVFSHTLRQARLNGSLSFY
jgi:ABC-2 type transport system permease protein